MYATTAVGVLYALYTLLTLSVFGWFAHAVTRKEKARMRFKISLGAWIVFLSAAAVGFHIVTYIKLPWVRWEISGRRLLPKKEVTVNIRDYKFRLSQEPVKVKKDEPVRFTAFSEDVTYGFGVFRQDGTLLFQMQVLPGRANEITWIFQDAGKYTIRSTEYSGPENYKMVLRDAVIVTE